MSKEGTMTPMTIALRLTIISAVAVISLIGANLLTFKKIEQNSIAEEKKANNNLFKEAFKFEKMSFGSLTEKDKKIFYYYKAYDMSGSFLGYVVYTVGKGFNGDMKIAFSADDALKIIKVKLMDNSETPGYGKKYEDQKNVRMFSDSNTEYKKIPDSLLSLNADDKEAVTSATISFKGISGGIKKAVELLKKEI